MVIVKFSLSIAIAIICFACGQENIPPSGLAIIKEDDWSVSGKITAKSFANGEVIAIGMDGNRYYSHINGDAKFIINLPANVIYALYFIPSFKPKETAHDFIHYSTIDSYMDSHHEALLCFEESKDIGISKTLRLPKIITNSYLDLGEIDIKENYAFPTKNPALALDFDNDGINDFNDLDDQNDGLSDKQQKILLERVDICHLGDDGSKTENISLEALYDHMKHGDGFGACIATKAIKESLPSPNDEDVTDNSDKEKAHIPDEDHQDNVIEITPEAEGEPNGSHDHKKPKNKAENNDEAYDDKPKKDQKKAKEDKQKDSPNKE